MGGKLSKKSFCQEEQEKAQGNRTHIVIKKKLNTQSNLIKRMKVGSKDSKNISNFSITLGKDQKYSR
jgi:hypothetical protein